MISAGDFRNNMCFEMDGQVYQVVEFQHVKPGKGAAFVRTKYKNVKTGSVVERSFNPNEKFEQAQLDRRDMQYLYSDGDLYYFMDQESYDQMPIHAEAIGEAIKFLKEEMICKVLSYKGEIFSVELPITVELEIVECEPGVRGDTANNVTKYATLETGAVIKVPLFVNQNEFVRVDTRTGEYLERA
ncbi:MAG: elongation factor P [Clostridiales bacterium]|nr:elongation factor P [Clostridiales bacterium]